MNSNAADRRSDPPQFLALGSAWEPAGDPARLAPVRSIEPTELGRWIDRLRRAGIVADRRCCPDLFTQLGQALRRPIDTVLCVAKDGHPQACLNGALAARFGIELAAGTLLVGRITRAARTMVVVDDHLSSSWLAVLKQACRQAGVGLEGSSSAYPQSDPTLMLLGLLGRRLRPRRLPTDQGVVLLDGAAAVSIGRLALLDQPMLSVPVAAVDHVLGQSHYAIVPVGMTVAELFQQLGLSDGKRTIWTGDLLRDVKINPDMVIGGGELVLHAARAQVQINPNPCIRCGWCLDVCPTGVNAAMVLEAAQQGDMLLAERAGIEACLECGLCGYVCPSSLPLLEAIRACLRKQRKMASSEPEVGSAGAVSTCV